MADPNGKLRIDPSVALQIVAWFIAAAVTYAAISSRVAVVETKQTVSDQRLERVESKIDRLLELAR